MDMSKKRSCRELETSDILSILFKTTERASII